MTDSAPLVRTFEVAVPAAAAGVDLSTAIAAAPFDCTVTGVTYVPSAAITGADTNTRTISIVNKQQGGAGAVSVATLALVSGVNAAAHDEKALTLSGTPANLAVAAGDVLAFASIKAASGLADPGGLVRITVTRRD